ncbi:bactericidal permeability-increasing bpi protein-related [Anaeramoeba ignava]|uniref:Bactericidal permeability-increasing bpi protein-related n=1 Tax=Anaeramoeba ignava TaxID=1746090 RepID=A0A9Q0LI08_ANAIG|nr:bactericidal permeability-increasing bpi protein-related [Anaeramoeba ignava]|eukprot:Anaeramoba_ignava/a478195_181.p1 GENE.a478195_181~~a478195_181.p1  ORF type:complete len:485 (-),score=112.82 a478195_181:311-1765(-)
MQKLILLIILIGIITTEEASLPGFKISLTKPLFDEAIKILVPLAIKDLQNMNIPDIDGDFDSPIGKIEYQFTSIKLNSISLSNAKLSLVSGGISISISGGSASLSANWHWKEKSWPHVSDSGSVDIDTSSVSASVSLAIGSDSNGRPTIVTSSISLDLGSLNVHFHGGDSWLYNLFSGEISDKIKSSVESEVNSKVKPMIDQAAEKFLSTVPLVEPIDSNVEIDYRLVSTPEIEAGKDIMCPLKGEFYYIPHPHEYPIAPVTMPSTINTEMGQFFISEFVFNSLAFSYYQTGMLSATVTPQNVPSWFPFKLNTTAWKDLIPQLFNTYPGQTMNASIGVNSAPVCSISSSGILLQIDGFLRVNVIQSSKMAFILNLFANAQISMNISDAKIYGNFNNLTTKMTLNASTIGQFSLDSLDQILDLMTQNVLVPLLNELFQKGYPLPVVDGAQLVEPHFYFYDKYMAITSDFKYTPSNNKIQQNWNWN